MAHAFVKQPDGKFAIWSTVVDNFITVDCTADEAIEAEAGDPLNCKYPGDIRKDCRKELERIARTGRAGQFAPTWDEAVAEIRRRHGEEAIAELAAHMEHPPSNLT